jgi:phosphonate dehydrogenase
VRHADAELRQGDFQGWRPRHYGFGIDGATIAILGMGAIGRAVATRLQGWGAQLRYTDRERLPVDIEEALRLRFQPLDQLLAESDIVMLALPLNATTLHLIDTQALATMKPGAYLINPCRGSVVDECAVLAALERGHLAGYAADVFEMEDWARHDRPRRIDAGLLSHARTLLTPHLGSAVADVRLAIEQCAATNILMALAGHTPPDAINTAALRAVNVRADA